MGQYTNKIKKKKEYLERNESNNNITKKQELLSTFSQAKNLLQRNTEHLQK